MIDCQPWVEFLAQPVVQQLLSIHPNDAALSSFNPPNEWSHWWVHPPDWRDLIAVTSSSTNAMSPDIAVTSSSTNAIRPLLAQIAALQLPRDPIPVPPLIAQSTRSMSPKKHHEVTRMTDYIARLLSTRFPTLDPAHVRLVDIGAGQGYVTRALHAHLGSHTLALDADHAQTTGAETRTSTARITHRTLHITPDTLLHAIDDWIPTTTSDVPVPVLFIALHACGSLTPDILRAFLRARAAPHPLWTPLAVVAVGCCYNLLHPADFPLAPLSPPPVLPLAAYHLAAQIPSHWSDSPQSLAAAALSIRKVVWRALLARLSADIVDHTPNPLGTGSTPAMQRLGRLRDAAYLSWPDFLAIAGPKLGADFSAHDHGRNPLLERRLEVLHVLRCLLGPVIESLIVLDRVAWVRAELASHDRGGKEGKHEDEGIRVPMHVEAVNLFDQATGSGRNIAIVVAPPPPCS
jgi:hypothetical protein